MNEQLIKLAQPFPGQTHPSGVRRLKLLIKNRGVEIRPVRDNEPQHEPPLREGHTNGDPNYGKNRLYRGSTSGLTPREVELLKFVAEGLTNRQIADKMYVSIKTVQKHRQAVMDKLNLHDTAGLTRYAVKEGILWGTDVHRILSNRLHGESYHWGEPSDAKKEITAREAQVLKLIADGLVNKQIASELKISIKTVGNHRQGLMNRLNIHQVAGLTRYAISKGLVAACAQFSNLNTSTQRLAFQAMP